MNHLWHARGRLAESRAKHTGLARVCVCSRNLFTSQDGSSGTGCRKPLAGPVVNDLEITSGMRAHHDMGGASARYTDVRWLRAFAWQSISNVGIVEMASPRHT